MIQNRLNLNTYSLLSIIDICLLVNVSSYMRISHFKSLHNTYNLDLLDVCNKLLFTLARFMTSIKHVESNPWT